MEVIKRYQIDSRNIFIVTGNIVKANTDAIVNAANGFLQHGGGVARAISMAGGEDVQKSSDKYIKTFGPIQTGKACILPVERGTASLQSTVKFIVHAVGPQWPKKPTIEGVSIFIAQLHSAVTNALKLADDNECATVAVPTISSGIFGGPVDQCTATILTASADFLEGAPAAVQSIYLYAYSGEIVEAYALAAEVIEL